MSDFIEISYFSLHNEKHPSESPLKGRTVNFPRWRGLGGGKSTEIYIARFFSDDSNK